VAEAEFLARILSKICGPPTGRRGLSDNMQRALQSVGIEWGEVPEGRFYGLLTVDMSDGD
jgi:hypothetical protein